MLVFAIEKQIELRADKLAKFGKINPYMYQPFPSLPPFIFGELTSG